MKNIKRTTYLWSCFLLGLLFQAQAVNAQTLYFPQQLPEQVQNALDTVLVVSKSTYATKPLRVVDVRRALDSLGNREPHAQTVLKAYLARFDAVANVSEMSVSLSNKESTRHVRPNEHGRTVDSLYSVKGAAFYRPSKYVSVQLGGVIYDKSDDDTAKNEYLENTYLSLAWANTQLDIGTRSHMWSPFQDNGLILSNNALSVPSVTLSNQQRFFGVLGYEVFYGQMSHSNKILSWNRDERLPGNPKLFGLNVNLTPIKGMTLSANRVIQYGGADRDESFSGLMGAFFNAKKNDNIGVEGRDFGNQLTSVNASYAFSTAIPFNLYMEYGGEDTSAPSEFHLGNSAMQFGINVPKLLKRFSLNYEVGEWQNAWYVNTNYGDGYRHHQRIMGHWGANERKQAGGAWAQMYKLRYNINPHSILALRYREVKHRGTGELATERGRELTADISTQLQAHYVGAELMWGQTIDESGYLQVSGYYKW